MSQSTLDEEKDQIKLYASKTIRTKRNHSLNLLSKDINGKSLFCHFFQLKFFVGIVNNPKLHTMPPRVPVSLQ